MNGVKPPTVAAPPWLSGFQAAFSAMLRTPLDRQTGTLRASSEHYPGDLCTATSNHHTARDRLAVYNRQYWFRLFGVMQHEYPLAAALTGMWWFNQIVSAFIGQHPPRGHDLAECGEGFDAFVADQVPALIDRAPAFAPLPRDALLEAVAIDRAFRAVFLAGPPAARATPLSIDANTQLRLAPGVVFVDETRPLLVERAKAQQSLGEMPLTLPPPYKEGPRTWAVYGHERGPQVAPLMPGETRLLRLLAQYPLAEALGFLEQTWPPDERDALPQAVQQWLARSQELGFWAPEPERSA